MNLLKKQLVAIMVIGVMATPLSVTLAKTGQSTEISPASSISNEIKNRLSTDTYIIDQKNADVTGDQCEDKIYLIGHKSNKEAIYADHLTLLVEDGVTRKIITGDLGNLGGYQGKLFTGDFIGNKIADVMVSVPTGGSGGMVDHRILSFQNGQPTMIFNQDNNRGLQLTGEFVDGFKAQLTNEEYGIRTMIDLQTKKELYVTSQIYDGDGKVLKDVKPMSYPLASLEPVDLDRNGVYELRGIQRIIGAYGADGIGHAYSDWKYENNNWSLQHIEITAFVQHFQEMKSVTRPSAKTIVLTEANHNQEITVESGDEIKIKLQEISGTGYRWQLGTVDNDGLELVSETTEKMENPNGMVGTPYTRVFTLKSKKIGDFNIQLANSRSWEGKDKAVNHFTVTIHNVPKGL